MLALSTSGSPSPERAQVEFSSARFTTSDGVELHYLEAGSGPLMVLVPGWTMPAWMWEHQIRHFSATHRVVALDPRGQGDSDKPSFGYQPSRRAQDIHELLEHLDDGPAVLAGWSLGMQEVLLCAHEFGTDRIRALVLVDHPIYIEDPTRFTSRFVSMQTEREEWMQMFVGAVHATEQSEAYLEALTRDVMAVPGNATAILIGNIILMGPTDLRPMLEEVDRPKLFIYSALNWSQGEAETIRETMPDTPVRVIDDTSHALFVDQPEAFNQALEAMLEDLE